jgi:glucose/arabinose dehydrogenase
MLAAAAVLMVACSEDSQDEASAELPFRITPATATTLPPGYRIEALLDGLELPTSIAALPDGRLLITEQETGQVRVVEDGRLLDTPWIEVPVTFYPRGFFQELGLVSVAVDPRFEENGYVYLYYSQDDAEGAWTVFARAKEVDGRGTALTRLVTMRRAPDNQHIAGGIAFDGPDAILLGVGDHEFQELAQDRSSPMGKILRMDRDGHALPDNPFVGEPDADPRVYAYGMRNPFGVAVDPTTGRAFFTDNRDTVGDALYELEAGADYGWPSHLLLREPLVLYDIPMGVSGIAAYRGTALPELTGGIFYCSFHGGGGLYWLDPGELEGLDISKRNRLLAPGCTTGVAEGADGFLYYLSHSDGRLLRIATTPDAEGS